MPAMNPSTEEASPKEDRLERFRKLRARLDPAGDPARAIAEGFYVQSEKSVSSRLRAELALSPASSHILIGGVGSGKTTEMLEARDELNQIPDTHALYIDVSKSHDIGKITPGAIAVQVGLALGEWLVSTLPADSDRVSIRQSVKALSDLAYGTWVDSREFDEDPDLVHVPGILVTPDQFEEHVSSAISSIKDLLNRRHAEHVVALLDGLDRMTDMPSLEQLIEHDVRALNKAGVGVVLVGPLRALYGISRAVVDRFDGFHYQPWIDQASGYEADYFLRSILQKRIPNVMIEKQGLDALIRGSGGVLRDLLSLAQSACVEAYLNSQFDTIDLAEANAAIDAFGRKHMQGLRPAEIEVLQRVRIKGTFVQTSEDDLALLMTRRVLEYRANGRPRYAVHPTIEPLLREMSET
jgi:hypothetical protein